MLTDKKKLNKIKKNHIKTQTIRSKLAYRPTGLVFNLMMEFFNF